MNFLRSTARLFEQISEFSGRVTSWLTSILVLIIGYDVAMRYLANQTSIAIFELEWHLYSMIFLLGAAYTLKHDKHVRVDVFYSQFSEKGKAWVNLLGTLCWLLPFALVVVWVSWKYTLNSFAVSESSPDPGGLPARYFIKACISLGFTLLVLQAIALLLRSVNILVNSPISPSPEKELHG